MVREKNIPHNNYSHIYYFLSYIVHACQDCSIYLKVACEASFSLWFWSTQRPWNNAMFWPHEKWTESQKIKEVGGGEGEWKKETLADKPRDFENPGCQ